MTQIAIIGAGPAGSATAIHLVRAGVDPGDITMFDRALFPRDKLCGGAIPARGTREVADLVGRSALGCVTNGLELRIDDVVLPVREKARQWLYDRSELDNRLMRECRHLGVEVRDGVSVKSLRESGDRWQLDTSSHSSPFDLVIGADGSRGVVSRTLGLGCRRIGRLIEGVFEPVDTVLTPNRLYMDFSVLNEGIGGYTWIFPYPSPSQRTGLWKIGIMDGAGRTPGRVLRDAVDRYAARFGFRAVGKLTGWPERYIDVSGIAHRPGVVVTGEAWGIDHLLGEGIAPSLFMARYTAARIREALDAGRRTIPNYERRFFATLEGINLLFQAACARAVYCGDHGNRLIRSALTAPGMRRFCRFHRLRYGRVAHLAAPLVGYCMLNGSRPGSPGSRSTIRTQASA